MEALRQLKAADPPLFLSPSQELSQNARLASHYFFSALKPYSLNCPLPELVTDGFDAEQIWAQIESQTQPLLKMVTTQFRNLEKNPLELEKQFILSRDKGKKVGREKVEVEEIDGLDDGLMEESDDEEASEEEEEEEEEEEGDEEEGDGLRDVEDEFLKIRELERYLEADEAREYGVVGKEKKGEQKKRKRGVIEDSDDEDQDDEEGEDEDEDEDELGLMEMDGVDDEDEDGEGMEYAKYDDFFGSKKKIIQKKTFKPLEGSDDFFGGKKEIKPKKTSKQLEGSDDSDLDERPNTKKNLSTHEKEQEKLRSQIEEMEKSNLEPKEWMMQGEVTARTREKNSALEVDLDFEHNVRPAPVITEEVTATLEELIQKRILEGRFNDVQKPPTLLNKAPKEMKEMDENKSKKGLAEVYEEEYVQKTGLVSAALSFSDEQKKEASTLFKKLCLKLDALSHFHFTPKPVIEDMSIQANVPALAMEEITPMAVSDAAMLAPEEVFSGKGDIKEQTELTQAERKRRRANKKRKFKAESEKKMAGKAEKSMSKDAEGNEAS